MVFGNYLNSTCLNNTRDQVKTFSLKYIKDEFNKLRIIYETSTFTRNKKDEIYYS